jgi:hypothetical protein
MVAILVKCALVQVMSHCRRCGVWSCWLQRLLGKKVDSRKWQWQRSFIRMPVAYV